MNGCRAVCIILLWTLFLWPIIVSSYYLILKKQQLTCKGKYFLVSSLVGYTLIIGASALINLLKSNTIVMEQLIRSTESQQALTWWIEAAILFLPTIILSYILAKRSANKNLERNS